MGTLVSKRWLDKFVTVTLLNFFSPGYNGIARLLLSRGANVDLDSSEGTPLHVSAARGKFGVMEVLLELHADVIISTNFLLKHGGVGYSLFWEGAEGLELVLSFTPAAPFCGDIRF